MKRLVAVAFIALFQFFAVSLFAQGIDGVVNGIKKGDANLITSNAGQSFSLTIMDKSNNYAKAEAQAAIKNFFAQNAVKGFDVKHKGNSPNGQYAIGTLATASGNFRVNIFMKKEGGKEVIKELRFQLIE
ncbi:DUF4783 domain-containing protein [Niabella insulamsoli]|uniref:DUF4783 domain-containing protein n=1 Tax=Niabella insulamsoli TaxID=3144874 RepID=UPI0031FBFD8F